MKTIKLFRKSTQITNVFFYSLLVIMVTISAAPAQAQENTTLPIAELPENSFENETILESNNSTIKKNGKVRDHRTSIKSIDKSQTLSFDEGDAIFGKRTELQKKYPELKFTGKLEQIKITKKLLNGANAIYKTKYGKTVYATVKKGKITGLSMKNPKIENVKDDTSNTVVFQDNNSTCFWCTKYCHYPSDGGEKSCWTTCEIVDCYTEAYNAIIPGKVVGRN